MRSGTCHFRDVGAAVRYYALQQVDEPAVMQKISAGEILIGRPPDRVGEVVILDRAEGRYFYQTTPARK